MIGDLESFAASRALVGFVHKYAVLTELQIKDVRDAMNAAVVKIIECVNRVSDASDSHKARAEKVMLDAHFRPDPKTTVAMAAAQASIDDVFQEATAVLQGSSVAPNVAEMTTATQVRRQSGLFSKSVEALSGLAGDFMGPLSQIMGVLSAEDVVGQRLNHISQTADRLAHELDQLLNTFDSKFNKANIEAFSANLRSFTAQLYTLPAERKILDHILLAAPPARESGRQMAIGNDASAFLNSLHCFVLLLKEQIADVKSDISTALSKAMAAIMEINAIIERKKSHASTILVQDNKKSGGGKFVPMQLRQEEGGGAGTTFSKPVAMLADLDKEVSGIVMAAVGELSVEDVVAQRLEHIADALAAEEKLIEIVVTDMGRRLRPESVQQLTQTLLGQLWAQYTMESEKHCFETVFGGAYRSANERRSA